MQLTGMISWEGRSDPGDTGVLEEAALAYTSKSGSFLTREWIMTSLRISSKIKWLKQLIIVLHNLMSFFFLLK